MGRSLEQRALVAYRRSFDGIGQLLAPHGEPEIREHARSRYVVLSNTYGVLAVYLIRIVKGEPALKGLKCWPKELAA